MRRWLRLVLWAGGGALAAGLVGFAAGAAITDRLEQDNRFYLACHRPEKPLHAKEYATFLTCQPGCVRIVDSFPRRVTARPGSGVGRRVRWQRPGDSVDRVRRYLERRIIEGELKPGQRLVEQDISRRLGLSRSPVREALRLLTSDGLIEFHPRRGGRITSITAEDVRETFQVFEVLETLSTRLAAGNVSDQRLRILRRLLAGMRRAVTTGDVRRYFRFNAKFHRAIYDAAGNKTLQRVLLNLGKQITRFRFAALATPGRMARSLREHRALVEALKRGDERAATGLARTSVAHACQALVASPGLGGDSQEGARGKTQGASGADHRRRPRAWQRDRAGLR